MAFMQSCCCWRSVRRGSFACAVYTGIYFGLLVFVTGAVLTSEYQYMWGNNSVPETISIIEPERMSEVTIGFHVSFFICSILGVISSVLLLIGLFKDRPLYLLPWIINVTACCLLDVTHCLYVLSLQGFNPATALLYTFNFFLLALNVYSLLCVISQYQEYEAGRGRAIDDCEYRVPAIRYAVQPTTTATSCLSSNKRTNVTSNDTKSNSATGTTSPSLSSTAPHQRPIISAMLDKSVSPASGTVRKHVQFPDQQTARLELPGHVAASEHIETTSGIQRENARASSPSLLSPAMKETTQIQLQSTRNQTQS